MNEMSVFSSEERGLALVNTDTGAMVAVEQSRAVAEVQAAIVIAKANPRNEVLAEKRITDACKRKSLAETSTYAFKRGSTLVTGPSIRLAEVLARYWGNLNYGFREIGRSADSSEVEAFCHDYETNVRVSRVFQVKHWRDKTNGGQALTQERDKYELIANQAQRRVRACILEIIPGDIVELAEEACKATLNANIGDPAEAGKKIVAAFTEFGVTQEMIEAYLQRKIASLVAADIINLRRIHTSIKNGIAAPGEFFKDDQAAKVADKINTATPAAKEPSTHPPPSPEKFADQPPASDAAIAKEIATIDRLASSVAVDRWRMANHERVAKLGAAAAEKIMAHAQFVYEALSKEEEAKEVFSE